MQHDAKKRHMATTNLLCNNIIRVMYLSYSHGTFPSSYRSLNMDSRALHTQDNEVELTDDTQLVSTTDLKGDIT